MTWNAAEPPDIAPPGLGGWLRVVSRGLPLALVVFGGLALLLVLRLVERPLFGLSRPVTPWITQGVCRSALWILGLRYRARGRVLDGPGAMVANHASWIDVLALNALTRLYFVSKDEVAGWPGIGWLARATGTLFIRRDRREASAQVALLARRLAEGQRLLFFPEGTSTDGLRVLPFKPTLFAAFLDPALGPELRIQAITVVYRPPPGAPLRMYGFWGTMGFGEHLLRVLTAPRQGSVTVILHPPVRVGEHPDRKRLAAALEAQVRSGLDSELRDGAR